MWFYVGRWSNYELQVDYMSSALIPAEAIENNQEHVVVNKVGSITLLV